MLPNGVACSESVFVAESCGLQQIGVPCQNCVVCNDVAFATKIVLSAANQRSLLKVCCLHWICDSLPKLSCLQRISVCCWNWIVYNELAFTTESVLVVTNQRSPLKMCCLQWICDSLPKLSCLQWISVRCRRYVLYNEFMIRYRNWIVYSELAFTTKSVLPTVNQHSLSKLCCLQRISICYQSCVVCSGSVIRCWNRVACSELAFAIKSLLATAK